MPVPVFAYICFTTYLIPVVIGLMRFKKLTFPMRLLSALCVVALLEGSFGLFVGHLKIRNYFISEFYVAIEASFLFAIYYASVAPQKRKLIIAALGVLFILLWLVTMIVAYNPYHLGGGMSVVERLFLIVASLITYQSMIEDSSSRLVERSLFWMVLAVILYSTGSLLVIGLGDRLLKMNYWLLYVAYHINWSLEIAANLLYSKALLCKS